MQGTLGAICFNTIQRLAFFTEPMHPAFFEGQRMLLIHHLFFQNTTNCAFILQVEIIQATDSSAPINVMPQYWAVDGDCMEQLTKDSVPICESNPQ